MMGHAELVEHYDEFLQSEVGFVTHISLSSLLLRSHALAQFD